MTTHFGIWKRIEGLCYEMNPQGLIRSAVDHCNGLTYVEVKHTKGKTLCLLQNQEQSKQFKWHNIADLMLATWGFTHNFSKKRRDWINKIARAFNEQIEESVRTNTGKGVPKKAQHFRYKKDHLGRTIHCTICGKPLKESTQNHYYHQACARSREDNFTTEDLFPGVGTAPE